MGLQFQGTTLKSNFRASRKIEADFQSSWMETPRPIQFPMGHEVIPLDAKAQLSKTPTQLSPARSYALPGVSLCKPGFISSFKCLMNRACAHTTGEIQQMRLILNLKRLVALRNCPCFVSFWKVPETRSKTNSCSKQ